MRKIPYQLTSRSESKYGGSHCAMNLSRNGVLEGLGFSAKSICID